ncbi:MAG: dihydrofolate reductase [Polyangiaceae bacterium]|nr:dihydrofolate reductase [Polyangiaceae bacterium]
MRRLVYFIATTADGSIAGPNGEFDFFPMEGDHIAAQVAELPETLPRHVRELLGVPTRQARFDTVVMGRATYEPALSAGLTDPYAPLETIVFSRTLPARAEGALRVTSEDPAQVVRGLKAREGRDIWLCGGGKLASALAGEIDEIILKVNPVLAPGGLRLFHDSATPRALTLRSRREFESGVSWLSFEVS